MYGARDRGILKPTGRCAVPMVEPIATPNESAPGSPRTQTPRMFAATLFCEMFNGLTPHRILRMDPTRRSGVGPVGGTARCRVCQWTHRFESRPPGQVEVSQIISTGRISERSRIALPAHSRVQVGTGVPGSEESFRIRRIDTRSGARVRSASTDDVATLWVVR